MPIMINRSTHVDLINLTFSFIKKTPYLRLACGLWTKIIYFAREILGKARKSILPCNWKGSFLHGAWEIESDPMSLKHAWSFLSTVRTCTLPHQISWKVGSNIGVFFLMCYKYLSLVFSIIQHCWLVLIENK